MVAGSSPLSSSLVAWACVNSLGYVKVYWGAFPLCQVFKGKMKGGSQPRKEEKKGMMESKHLERL